MTTLTARVGKIESPALIKESSLGRRQSSQHDQSWVEACSFGSLLLESLQLFSKCSRRQKKETNEITFGQDSAPKMFWRPGLHNAAGPFPLRMLLGGHQDRPSAHTWRTSEQGIFKTTTVPIACELYVLRRETDQPTRRISGHTIFFPLEQ